jgi:hypothetical protein
MSDRIVHALLGKEAGALRPDVSFASPLTLSRLVGRDQVVNALTAYAGVFGATDADLRLHGEELEGAVFTTTIDGHTAQVLAVVTHDNAGLIATVDMYGRPWPYMALVRERLAKIEPDLADPDLGTVPYVPEGPGTTWIQAPPIPPLAENVAFHSPVLTATATGRHVNERILTAASEVYGEQKFRAVLQVDGQQAIAGAFDGIVNGHVLQLVAIFGLNDKSEISDIRIFSRPWPVTAYFRAGMYDLLADILGPEYWLGPSPKAPLPVR